MSAVFPELPRVRLARLPTPIEPLERLSARLPGYRVHVKRDDLTGFALTGNKVRKLEFLVAEAEGRGADTLVTTGGIQSNHARTTAIVAAMRGMGCRLVLRGEPGEVPEANELLDRLAGATARFIGPPEWPRRDEILFEEAEALSRAGRKPYVIPEGGSNALGSMGYVVAMREVAEFQLEKGFTFDAIYHATGSGGTSAGIVAGAHVHGLGAEVVGGCVCSEASWFEAKVGSILEDMRRLEVALPAGIGARYADGFVGEGYAKSTAEEVEFYADVLRTEGLLLDPVYTGKAFRAMWSDLVSSRVARRTGNVLFVHTGGGFGWFTSEHARRVRTVPS